MGFFSKKKITPPAAAGPKPRMVLIVDDDMTISDIEKTVFQGRDWVVKTAYDAAGAISSINLDKPDLLLLDLMLPDLPGEEVIKSIRSLHSGTKVIVVTGRYVTKKDFEKYEGTVLYVLRKPYEVADLRKLVEWFEGGTAMVPHFTSIGDD